VSIKNPIVFALPLLFKRELAKICLIKGNVDFVKKMGRWENIMNSANHFIIS
jgi:hypothetical protein